MPCFDRDQAYAEGIVVGRILAGYGELELQMCLCRIVAEGTIDIPIREIYGKRGAERRIEIARKALQADYAKAGLMADLTEALDDLDWCREIRNQYSHCQWFWTKPQGLRFANLEELASQPTTITEVVASSHPVDLALLEAQENYSFYVKQCLMHLETAYRAWDHARARGGRTGPPGFVYPKPPKIPRPAAHN